MNNLLKKSKYRRKENYYNWNIYNNKNNKKLENLKKKIYKSMRSFFCKLFLINRCKSIQRIIYFFIIFKTCNLIQNI